MNHTAPVSPITWPSRLKADKAMIYESIDLLYHKSPSGSFDDQLGFILSCSRPTLFKGDASRSMLHKLEVSTLPDFARAKMEVTHEVLPGLGPASQIISVNQHLKVAGFDSGCIIPIKNYGYKKTFNSDVRGRLAHHTGQVCCLAANTAGTELASGCTRGEITLYQVCRDSIRFLSRADETDSSFITAMSYLSPDGSAFDDKDNHLVYASDSGRICLMDTRCNLASPPKTTILLETNPRVSVTCLVSPRSRSEPLIYLGGAHGELMACDLRKGDCFVNSIQATHEQGSIRRMKEIVIQDGNYKKAFIAFSNSSNQIKIIDLETYKTDNRWLCDRLPEDTVRDLIQVGDRIVTCGDNASIGCWYWNRRSGGSGY